MAPDDSPHIMSLMGSLVVCDLEELGRAMKRDRVPRYEVCKSPRFSERVEPWEVASQDTLVYLKPEHRSFLSNMNSSEPQEDDSNVEAMSNC